LQERERERPRSHEKLAGIKMFCKLLEIKILEILKIKIDHKKQENEGL